MPRNVEDIIPQRRSIRDVPIPESRRRMVETPNYSPPPSQTPPPRSPTPPPPREEYVAPSSKGRGHLWLWIGGVVLVVVLVFAAFSLTGGATLTYTPKSLDVTLDNSYSASKSADPSAGKLPYSLVQISGDKAMAVPASGQETVSTKAQGTIIVYNNYSSQPQKLVANTRFQTTDGKIFRIKDAVTVPGKGSVEAQAVADQPGDSYNIPLSDFTIPGLKDTPQYSGVYGRSKTPMTGGFSGQRSQVSDSDLAKAKSALESALKGDLLAEAKTQVPGDFVLVPDLVEVTPEAPVIGNATGAEASVTEHGNLVGVMFKKSDLANFLALQKVDKASLTGPVEIVDFSGLKITAATSTRDLLNSETVNFKISGNATLKWLTNTESLANDLAGHAKSELEAILKNYPSIQSASAIIKPFWKSTFPTNPAKVTIKENAIQ